MTLPLTPKQERLWRFIGACDRSPTFNEMAEAVGYKSKGQLYCVIRSLEEKGFIHRHPGRARAIVAVNPRLDLRRVSTAALQAELERRSA